MLQVFSPKPSPWIACTATLMVYLALSIVAISLTKYIQGVPEDAHHSNLRFHI